MNKLPSTAVIDPPSWSNTGRDLPTTAEVGERIVALDPEESDEDWEARVIATCSPRTKVLALRD